LILATLIDNTPGVSKLNEQDVVVSFMTNALDEKTVAPPVYKQPTLLVPLTVNPTHFVSSRHAAMAASIEE
jgi:hypothetical protein